MKVVLGLILGLILTSSAFTSNASAFEFVIRGTSFSIIGDLIGDPTDPGYCNSAYQDIKSYASNLNSIVPKDSSQQHIWQITVNSVSRPNSVNWPESYLALKWFLDNVCGGKIPKEAKLNPQAQKMVELTREKSIELGHDFYSNGDYAKKLDGEKDIKKNTEKTETKKKASDTKKPKTKTIKSDTKKKIIK